MSKSKRNRYSGEFKAKVAREAMKEETTIADIAARYNIHPNQVGEWKRQAIERLAEAFTGKTRKSESEYEAEVKELHAKIGQLTMEKDFLAKAFGR